MAMPLRIAFLNGEVAMIEASSDWLWVMNNKLGVQLTATGIAGTP